MQERYIFREMLSEIKELADQKGNVLTLDEVKDFFKNAHLTDEQLNMVCVYLIGEKIRVEGYEGPEKQEQTPERNQRTFRGGRTQVFPAGQCRRPGGKEPAHRALPENGL